MYEIAGNLDGGKARESLEDLSTISIEVDVKKWHPYLNMDSWLTSCRDISDHGASQIGFVVDNANSALQILRCPLWFYGISETTQAQENRLG